MGVGDQNWREAALRGAALAGDEAGWQSLYDDNFDRLYRFVAWRLGARRDLVEEIVQETWLIAIRRLSDFDPRRGRFLDWLRGIANNAVRTENRRRAGEPAPLAPDAEPAAPEPASRDWQETIVMALDRLEPKYAGVLRAKYFDELTVEQLATRLCATPKAVESLLSRARAALRRECERMETHASCRRARRSGP